MRYNRNQFLQEVFFFYVQRIDQQLQMVNQISFYKESICCYVSAMSPRNELELRLLRRWEQRELLAMLWLTSVFIICQLLDLYFLNFVNPSNNYNPQIIIILQITITQSLNSSNQQKLTGSIQYNAILPKEQANITLQRMKQEPQQIQIVKQLYHIYPDIQNQLCSRHSTLFGKLRSTFNKLYDNMQPRHYVIANGNCQFVEESFTQIKLSMALENGIISLVSKTYPMTEIYVNCNHFSQELIFSHTGHLQQGLYTFSQQLSQIIKDVTLNLPSGEINGGILYIHANIPQLEFNYKQALYIAFYLSILSINDSLKKFTITQLIDRMVKLQFIGTREEIERQFLGYKNKMFNLTLPDLHQMRNQGLTEITGQSNEMDEEEEGKSLKVSNLNNKKVVQKSQLQLPIENEYKLVFCKLDLARQDVEYQIRRRSQISTRKEQLLQQLREKHKVSGLFDLFHQLDHIELSNISFQSHYQKSPQLNSMQELDCEQEENDNILNHPSQFLGQLLKQIQLINDFINQRLTLQQLIQSLWIINSQNLKLHSTQVIQLVQSMKQSLQINSCMIINRQFLLILIPKNQFTQLLCQFKHKMNRGQLKSKSLFRIEDEELILHRWSTDKVIGETIFSSVPAHGVGVFDPSQSIWFD